MTSSGITWPSHDMVRIGIQIGTDQLGIGIQIGIKTTLD